MLIHILATIVYVVSGIIVWVYTKPHERLQKHGDIAWYVLWVYMPLYFTLWLIIFIVATLVNAICGRTVINLEY